jgi:hypothetical protein
MRKGVGMILSKGRNSLRANPMANSPNINVQLNVKLEGKILKI